MFSANTSQVAAGAVNYIEDVFSTYLYTGNGSTQTITNGIDLSTKGGLVWTKARIANSNGNHLLVDTARGAGYRLQSNTTDAQYYNATAFVTSFNSNGYNIGDGYQCNESPTTYVSWTFREQAKFFDVVTYTGNGTNGRTVAHNLGSAPGCIIIKRTSATGPWYTWHRSLTADKVIYLNTTAAQADPPYGAGSWISSDSTTVTFPNASIADVNNNGYDYVMYVFAHNAGGFGLTGTDNVITCGSYSGNGSSTGPVIDLGYEPQWVMIKKSSGGTIGAGSSDWMIFDIMRGFSDSDRNDNYLNPNLASEENSLGSGNFVRPLSTGFQPTGSFDLTNQTGSTYIYIAIRRGPMKIPTVGTSVFNPYTATLSAGTTVNAGLTPDLLIGKYRAGADAPRWVDRLRAFAIATGAANPQLRSDTTDAEVSSTAWTYNWNNTGYIIGNALNGLNSVIYAFGRAPSFFDEVCYTGTGSVLSLTHNLGVAPEFILIKSRSGSSYWILGSNFGASTYALKDDWGYNASNASRAYSSTVGFNAQPTATTVSLSTNSALNVSGSTYAMWMWATCAGVSKVGTYTGTGALQTINCGFTSGARFVLITRIGVVGDVNTYVYDSARGITSSNDPYLLLESTAAEVTSTNYVDTTSTGYQVTAAASSTINVSGGTYIYLAIA